VRRKSCIENGEELKRSCKGGMGRGLEITQVPRGFKPSIMLGLIAALRALRHPKIKVGFHFVRDDKTVGMTGVAVLLAPSFTILAYVLSLR